MKRRVSSSHCRKKICRATSKRGRGRDSANVGQRVWRAGEIWTKDGTDGEIWTKDGTDGEIWTKNGTDGETCLCDGKESLCGDDPR